MTYYANRNTVNNIKPRNMKVVTNLKKATLAKAGLVLLSRNNNYSNTMLPCVYLCKTKNIKWM